ncbi:MAG: hypothetical protein L6R45_15420 [Anaerolineae bacterium]|nr:hypothetical protein [Anaerolineae bacterium]
MKSAQLLPGKAAAVTSNTLKNGAMETLVWREVEAGQGEIENILGPVDRPEKINFKRSRHSYTYYRSDF